jgi:hypothetical protein
MMPPIVATTPASPAVCQPISATNRMLGPGADWAMATEAVNCSVLSQPCCCTR